MGFRRWKLPQADPDRVKNLIDQTGMPPIAAQILEGRGVSEPEQAKAYAGFDREAKMHDPFLMLVRFLRDSRHNGKLPVYCHCARCVVLLQLIYQLIHGLIKLRDTLNKSGFREKRLGFMGFFPRKQP